MKTLLRFTLLLIASISIALSPGCAGKTPARISHDLADATFDAGDKAIEGWADHVAIRRNQIAAMKDPAEQKAATEELDKDRAKVKAAYLKYQKVAGTTIQLGSTAAGTTNSVASISSAASAALTELLTLIATLSTK